MNARKPSTADEHIKVIARNKRARFDYTIGDTFEAGIVLVGSEVKMLRQSKMTLAGAHVRIIGKEAFALGIQIPEYPQAHQFNHEVDRPRKLLLHRRELDKLSKALRERGTSCPILSVYWRGSNVKVEFALATGRRQRDQREVLKARTATREMDRARKGR